jgi:hypothetical protein
MFIEYINSFTKLTNELIEQRRRTDRKRCVSRKANRRVNHQSSVHIWTEQQQIQAEALPGIAQALSNGYTGAYSLRQRT